MLLVNVLAIREVASEVVLIDIKRVLLRQMLDMMQMSATMDFKTKMVGAITTTRRVQTQT